MASHAVISLNAALTSSDYVFSNNSANHFTPNLKDLSDVKRLDSPIYIRVADGSRMAATHIGTVEINFTSDEGAIVNLKLLRVLYVKGLQRRLFSVESFISNGQFSALYSKGKVKLHTEVANLRRVLVSKTKR